ncbi:uncharacterized protein [Oscarella lobularis]|uniref:uncharacterized protein n=1 Tax=Oscarella lobularis TaxID=121494 RepID=UPI00331341D9
MTTEASIEDQAKFDSGMADVRKDSSSTNWALFGHVGGDPAKVGFVATGTGGPEEFHGLLDDGNVMYALVRLEETIDMSQTVKFIYVRWLGEKIPTVKLGKYGVVHGSVVKHFQPHHMLVETGTTDDLTKDALMAKLSESSGQRSKVLDESNAERRQERGFTSGTKASGGAASRPNVAGSFAGMGGAAKKGAVIKIEADVVQAVSDVKADGSSTDWAVAGYGENNVKNPLVLLGSGSEGLDNLKELLTPEIAAYAILRVKDVVDDIATVKFVFIKWVGENVKPMSKAKISTHKADVEGVFHPAHISIFATQLSEVSQRAIMDRVQSASGSKSHVM